MAEQRNWFRKRTPDEGWGICPDSYMGWIATAVFVAVDVGGVAVLGAVFRRPPLCVASFGLGLRLARCIRCARRQQNNALGQSQYSIKPRACSDRSRTGTGRDQSIYVIT
jgi:hypothetical protein